MKIDDSDDGMLLVDYFREWVVQTHNSIRKSWESTRVAKYFVSDESVKSIDDKLELLFEQNFNRIQTDEHGEYLSPIQKSQVQL